MNSFFVIVLLWDNKVHKNLSAYPFFQTKKKNLRKCPKYNHFFIKKKKKKKNEKKKNRMIKFHLLKQKSTSKEKRHRKIT